MNKTSMGAVLFALSVFTSASAFCQSHSRAVVDSLNTSANRGFSSLNYFDISPSQSDTKRILPNVADTGMNNAGNEQALTLFGLDLFKPVDLDEIEAGAFSLPPEYRLGSGDRVGIYLLGAAQQNIDVMVNVEGKIFLPPAGVIDVRGLTMLEFKKLLRVKLNQFYDNLKLDIMLLQPKNVMVAVVGDVIRPGKYVLSALNTVLDAVVMAGGPTQHGSIRGIQLVRNDTLVSTVDLYTFLMSGNNKADAFLEAGDKIKVPLLRNRVSVLGEVGRPSIFELRPSNDEKVSDIIDLAGGFSDLAYKDKVEISRLGENGRRELKYVDFRMIAAGDSSKDIVLQNEDSITVYSVLERTHRREVAIYGEVRNPGNYMLEDNMHLSDLILKAGSLTRKAYMLEAEVAKVDPGVPTKFMKVNLNKMTNGTNGDTDIILEEDDEVYIRQIPGWEVGLTVEVKGEAKFPGFYPIIKDSTYLSEILAKAGGFTEEAFLQEAHVVRPSARVKFDKEYERLAEMKREEMSNLEYQYYVMRQNSKDVERIVVDFEKLIWGKKDEDIILENGDIIVVPKAPRVVMVTGSVANPGGVTYLSGSRVSYYLEKAGGASWDADPGRTKVIKVNGEVLDDEDVRYFEPGDTIWVPRRSDKNIWPTFLQTIAVVSQLASTYLIIDRAIIQ